MMNFKLRYILLAVFILLGNISIADSVDSILTKKVASNWYKHYAPISKKEANISHTIAYKWNDRISFYIYTFDQGGFVLVSANDAVNPVLGYGFERSIPDSITNEAVKGWFDGYARQVDTAFVLNIKSNKAKEEWNDILNNKFQENRKNSIGPLLTTSWDQVHPYNILCPQEPPGSGNFMPAGCTPIAVAQIMKYWNYPSIGIGYNEYAWSDQTIAAFFNEQSYNISAMPNSITQPDSAIALLLFHAGVASEVIYQSDGSGAYISEARNGMVNYFDYKPSAEHVRRWAPSLPDSIWIQMIKENIDSLKPIIYEGYGGIGHAWVCDGYDENDFFHMNWGWGGAFNGFFEINSLFPGGININGFQGAVFNIEPAYSVLNADFEVEDGSGDYQRQFIDFSEGAPSSRFWNFGDGETSFETNPTHQYDTVGVYDVSLIVSNNDNYDTIIKNVTVSFPYFTDIDLTVVSGVEQLGSYDLGDYDNDGDIDILIQYLGYVNGIRRYYSNIFKNENASEFIRYDAGFKGSHGGSINWFDLENDNELDCFINGFDMQFNSFINIYRNTNGYFEFSKEYNGFDYSPVTWGDLDNDGDLEFAVAIPGAKIIEYNNIDENMIYDTTYSLSHWRSNVDINICDINNDGLNEVPLFAKSGDFDNDGDLDGFQLGWFYYQNGEIVSFQDGEIVLNHNNILTPFAQTFPNGVDWGDFDGDGDYDILAANTVYRNDGGVFYDLEIGTVDAITWFDFDSDGDLDIVYAYAGAAYSNWKLLRNNVNPGLNAPFIPVNDTAISVENKVTICWDHPQSLTGVDAGYTYNLFIGNSDSTCEVLSPMAHLETGKRKIIEHGNASSDTSWSINRIPNGAYYYGIQSIDAQYKGSEFTIGTFTIDGSNIPAELLSNEKQCYVNLPLEFDKAGFSDCYIDPEMDTINLLKIVTLPEYGVLLLNDSEISAGEIILSESIQNLVFYTDTISHDHFLWTASSGDETMFSDIPASVNIEITPFQKQPGFNSSGMAGSFGDFDNDLDLDLLVGSVLLRNEEGSFSDTVLSMPLEFRSSSFVDYNSDGLLDLLVANDDIGLVFYKNMGNDIFEQETLSISSVSSPRYAIGDYNCDGFIDIILSGLIAYNGAVSDSYSTILYKNDQEGNFIPSNQEFTPVRAGMFSFGDIDNDGYPDLVMAGETNLQGGRILEVFINNGDGSFILSDQDLTGISYGSLDLRDVDLDGDLDLLTCGRYDYIYSGTYSSQTALYLNDKGFYTQVNDLNFSNINSGQCKFVDINLDGKLDILLNGIEYTYGQGQRYVSKLYLNRFPLFFEVEDDLPERYASTLEFGDIDNDGDEDVLLSGVDPNLSTFQSTIYLNTYGDNSYVINTPPSIPENLSSINCLGHVELIWDNSVDNTTPQADISHNIVISKLNDTSMLCAPLVSPIDSIRLISESGNIDYSKSYMFKKKPIGSYQWTVQSIDNSYAESKFASLDTVYFDGSPDVYDTIIYMGSIQTALDKELFNKSFIDYENDTLCAIKILSLPNECTLKYLGMNVNIGQEIRSDSIKYLELIPDPGFYGLDSLTWIATDGNMYSNINAKLNISVVLFKETEFVIFFNDDREKEWGNGAPSFGDYDNDNDLDLGLNLRGRITGWYQNWIYENNAGIYELKGNYFGGGRSVIHWGDIDGDHDLDYSTVAVLGQSGGASIIENTGDSFILKQSFDAMGHNSYWGDYNQDNLLDYPSKHGIFNNVGSGSFDNNGCNIWGIWYFNPINWSDINNNGNQDIVISKNEWDQSNFTTCYSNINLPSCEFIKKSLDPIPAVTGGSLDFADFDGDNDNDLIITGSLPSGLPYARIFENQNGNFTEFPATIPQLALGNSKWADLNLDGQLDIVMCGMDSLNAPQTKVLLNTPNGFVEIKSGLSTLGNGWLDVGDMDNDGDLDLVISGIDSLGRYQTKLYRNLLGNNSFVSNIVPNKPSGLQSIVNNNSVVLSWDHSTDDHTPQNSLSYNIFVRRAADGVLISSPLSDIEDGYRKVVQLGNASLNNHWRIDSLSAGIYTWSVQAIDNSFAGGLFADEQTFEIIDVSNQNLDLYLGWNLTSFYITPEDQRMDSIFSPLTNSQSLIKVIDETGNFIQNIPGIGWINTIGNMENSEGYYVKVANDEILTLLGPKVELPFVVPLITGWNITGYPLEVSQDAFSAYETLINNDQLIKVIDETGGLIEYIPGPGWINTIGNLEPGEGYYIKVTNDCDIVFEENSGKIATDVKQIHEGQNWKRLSTGNPYLPMHIISTFKDSLQLMPGDELGVFVDDLCIGSTLIDEPGSYVITYLNTNDPLTEEKEGGDYGDPLIIKLIHKGVEYELQELNSGPEDLVFESLSTKVFKFTADGLGIDATSKEEFYISEAIPNPTKDDTRLYISSKQSGKMSMELVDINGRTIRKMNPINILAGSQSVDIDTQEIPSGLYFIRIEIQLSQGIKQINRKLVVSE